MPTLKGQKEVNSDLVGPDVLTSLFSGYSGLSCKGGVGAGQARSI